MSANLSQQLAVSDVVNVTISLSATPAQGRNFDTLLILGPSPVIDTKERLRPYTSLEAVAADFGATANEYLAASLYFAQNPQPQKLYIGRWAKYATNGKLSGAPASQIINNISGTAAAGGATVSNISQLLNIFKNISVGSFTVLIDGSTVVCDGINLTSAQNFNAVASMVTQSLNGKALVVWNASLLRFEISSATAGAASSVGYLVERTPSVPGSTVSYLADLLGLTATAGGPAPVQGVIPEAPVQAVQAAGNQSAAWYGCMFADASIADYQHTAVSAYIEGAAITRIYGITTQESGVLDPTITNDIGSTMQSLNLNRTYIQYSSTNPYTVASVFGRAFSVDFLGENTVITLKFKQLPGVIAENLQEGQAETLQAKNVNVSAAYQNGVAILQEGEMSSGVFFDVIHGFDWLQNYLQNNLFNLLVEEARIPQTDAGVELLVGNVETSLAQAVANGLLAPGVWTNGLVFGSLVQGQTLTKGYYVFAAAIRSQSLADRAARKAPLLQAAVTGSGAVHFANLALTVVQ